MPRRGRGPQPAGRLRVPATLACALALVTLVACGNQSNDPESIDNWASQDATQPQQQSWERDEAGTGAGTDQDNSGEDSDVSSSEPIPVDHAALEVVRAWIRAETTAYRGGNRDQLRDLATPDCKACEEALDSIAEAYADDGRLLDRYTQTITFIQGVTGTSPPAVQTIIDRSARVLVDADGEVRERIPASTEALEFRTVKEGSRWLIADIVSAER